MRIYVLLVCALALLCQGALADQKATIGDKAAMDLFYGILDTLADKFEGEKQEAFKLLAERVQAIEQKLSTVRKDVFEEPVDDSDVVVLTGDSFEGEVKANDLTLVEFYAPWCGHCKALAPKYAKAATAIKGKGFGALAKVDCVAHADICSKHKVTGYPTIKLFRNDGSDPVDYNEGREADDIVSFMKKQSRPAVTLLDSAKDVKEFVAEEPISVVAFLAKKQDFQGFARVANKLRTEYAFAAVQGKDSVASEFGGNGIVLFRKGENFESPQVRFEGSLDDANLSEKLPAFINNNAFPIIGEIDASNYQRYVDRGLSFVWVFVDYSKDDQVALLDSVVKPIAQENLGKLSFVKMDGVKWQRHAEQLGLQSATPGVVIENRENRKNYLFEDELNAEDFGQFIKNFNNGALKAEVKSEPEPENNNGPVKVLVGKTIDEAVKDESKAVLVEFYAPWCGHCKSLAPKYEKLGEQFAKDDSIVIAKIDATANDAPVEVKGFPTIILFPAGGKPHIEYNGARETEDMAKWVKENAGVLKDEL